MDEQPAHLNRDSFRDSFEGLVALKIIIDLPFGFFPINNIISLYPAPILPCLSEPKTCHYLALQPMASKHAYLCAHPVITFSPFQSHLTFVISS